MNTLITKKDIYDILEQIEHPEIAASLIDLGMIMDVAIDGNTVLIAMALPMDKIPFNIENALIQRVEKQLAKICLKTKVHFFEMSAENRQKFFTTARVNWKGSL